MLLFLCHAIQTPPLLSFLCRENSYMQKLGNYSPWVSCLPKVFLLSQNIVIQGRALLAFLCLPPASTILNVMGNFLKSTALHLFSHSSHSSPLMASLRYKVPAFFPSLEVIWIPTEDLLKFIISGSTPSFLIQILSR